MWLLKGRLFSWDFLIPCKFSHLHYGHLDMVQDVQYTAPQPRIAAKKVSWVSYFFCPLAIPVHVYFLQACDEYFSKHEEQRIDVKQLNQVRVTVFYSSSSGHGWMYSSVCVCLWSGVSSIVWPSFLRVLHVHDLDIIVSGWFSSFEFTVLILCLLNSWCWICSAVCPFLFLSFQYHVLSHYFHRKSKPSRSWTTCARICSSEWTPCKEERYVSVSLVLYWYTHGCWSGCVFSSHVFSRSSLLTLSCFPPGRERRESRSHWDEHRAGTCTDIMRSNTGTTEVFGVPERLACFITLLNKPIEENWGRVVSCLLLPYFRQRSCCVLMFVACVFAGGASSSCTQ